MTKESHGETEPNGSLHAALRTLKSKGEVEGQGKKRGKEERHLLTVRRLYETKKLILERDGT